MSRYEALDAADTLAIDAEKVAASDPVDHYPDAVYLNNRACGYLARAVSAEAEVQRLRSSIERIHGLLRAAIGQAIPTDDAIIVATVKEADTVATEALWVRP